MTTSEAGPPSLALARILADRSWLWRGAFFGIALAAHLAGLLLLSRPAVPLTQVAVTSDDSARILQLRFVPASQRSAEVQKRLSRARRPPEKPEKERGKWRRAPVTAVFAVAPPPRPAPPTSAGLVRAPSAPDLAPAYISGGGLLSPDIELANQRPRLPGVDHVEGAPRFRMVPPQMQGVAGVIHLIGSFTGAVDPHCLDLEVWRGMTPQERIESHVSQEDIDRIESTYDCRRESRHLRR